MYDDGDFDPEDKPTRCPRCGGARFGFYRNDAGNIVAQCKNCEYRLDGDNDVEEGFKMDKLTKRLTEGGGVGGHCDCEAEWHEVLHTPGGCNMPASERVVSYGEAQWLCPVCAEDAGRVRLGMELNLGESKKPVTEFLDKRLDFTQYAATVALWPDAQLYAALEDIKKTLPGADAMDRDRMAAGGGGASEGGYYRDQAGVIRAEIARRQRNRLRLSGGMF